MEKYSHPRATRLEEIYAGNIGRETYYNVVQIANHSELPNPVDAAKSLGYRWAVMRDACGNITFVSTIGRHLRYEAS